MTLNKTEQTEHIVLTFDGTRKSYKKIVLAMQTYFKSKFQISMLEDASRPAYISLSFIKGRIFNDYEVEIGDTVSIPTWGKDLKVLATKGTKSSEPETEPSPPNEFQLNYINRVAPEHSRTSCNDENVFNAWFGEEDVLFGKCIRCTLLASAIGEKVREVEDDY